MSMPTRKNSLRYQDFDYSSPAGVFITIVTHNRQPIFGEIVSGEMHHSQVGRQVVARWCGISERFPSTMIDAYMVMPDHVHGVLWMGAADADPLPTTGDIVRWFKA